MAKKASEEDCCVYGKRSEAEQTAYLHVRSGCEISRGSCDGGRWLLMA